MKKGRWLGFVFFTAIAAALYFLLRSINFSDVYTILGLTKWYFVVLAVLATFLTFAIWAFRWAYFFHDVFKGDFWFLLNVIFAGAFFNTITPGAGIGGEPFRAHFLSKRYKKSKIKMLGLVLGDKFFQLITLAAFGIFSVLFVLIYVKISNTLTIILEFILIVVLVLAGLALYFSLKKAHFNIGIFFKKLHSFNFIKKYFPSQDHLERYLNKTLKAFLNVFRGVIKNKKNVFFGFLLSIAFWLLNYLTSYFLFLSLDYRVNFLSVIIVVTLANIIGDLSMIPVGAGVTEVSMILLYSAMGILVPFALVVSLLSRIIYYIFSLGVGGLSLLYVRRVTNGKKGFFG